MVMSIRRGNEVRSFNKEILRDMGIMSLDRNGMPAMVSHKQLNSLIMGAIGQLLERVEGLEAK